MVVSGKRFMLLTTRRGAVSDLVEVYGNDSLEEFRQYVRCHYPDACTSGRDRMTWSMYWPPGPMRTGQQQ